MKAFIYLFIFPLLSLACLQYLTPSCQNCPFSHYESLYPSKQILAVSESRSLLPEDCLMKNITYIKRTILITNSLCVNEDVNEYDECYEDFLLALQQESIKQSIYLIGSIDFKMKAGDHYAIRDYLITKEEELFRRSLFNISISPAIKDEFVSIFIKTNEFYFFISGELYIEEVEFHGKDIEVITADGLNCYNQKGEFCCMGYEQINDTQCYLKERSLKYAEGYLETKYYGLFNIEYMIDDEEKRIPKIFINNCSFQDFQAVNILNGWSTLIALGPYTGKISIINTIFNNTFFPKSLFYYSIANFDMLTSMILNYMKQINNDGVEQSFSMSDSIINNYNEFFIDNKEIGNFPIFNFFGFQGKFILTNNSFNDLRKGKQLFSILNTDYLLIDTININLSRGTDIFYLYSVAYVFIKNIFLNDTDSKYLTIENCDNMMDFNIIKVINFAYSSGDFFTISKAKIIFRNSVIENGNLNTNMISIVNSELQLFNCSFYYIACKNNFLSLMNAKTAQINNSVFINISQSKTLIFAFYLTNVLINNLMIKNCYSYNVFTLNNVAVDDNTGLYIMNSKLTYVWSSDHTCIMTKTAQSMISKNLIASKLLISRVVFIAYYFICDFVYLLENNSTSFTTLIMMGYTNFTNVQIRNNYFLDSDAYQYMFDFMNAKVYMAKCYMEDNGVIEKKKYYMTKDSNIMLSLWMTSPSYFIDCVFVVGKLIDLVSGFIESMPLSGDFYLFNSTFIMIEHNPDFGYKAILLDHFKNAQLINNTFHNIACNEQDFYHSHGGVILTAGSSYSYSKNNYYVYMRNNSFFNSTCICGGGLAIISISKVFIEDLYFFNTTSKSYGGHMIIAAGEQLTIKGIYLNLSSSNEGSGFIVQNFQNVVINNLSLSQAYSRKNGVIYFKNILSVEINGANASHLYTNMNGGFIYLMQSVAKISNVQIENSRADLRGGCIFLHGGSSLSFKNSFINRSEAFIGGVLSIENAKNIKVSDLTISEAFAEEKGACFYVDVLKNFTLENVVFENSHTDKDGIIFVNTEDEYASFDLQNVTCLNNTAKKEGSCIYYLSASRLILQNIKIISNGPFPLYIIWSFEIKITINNIIIKDSINELSSLLSISGVNLELDGAIISNNTVSNGYLLNLQSITGNFKNLDFFNNQGKYIVKSLSSNIICNSFFVKNDKTKIFDLSIFSTDVSSLIIQNFELDSGFSGADLFFDLNNGDFLFENCSFTNNSGQIMKIAGGNISVIYSKFYLNKAFDITLPNELIYENNEKKAYKITLDQCIFYISRGFSLAASGLLSISIINSDFTSFSNADTSFAILVTDAIEVEIKECKFQNFSDGTIHAYNNDKSQYSIFLINSSYFANNSGEVGSVFYLLGNFKANLYKNFFALNTALIKNNTNQKVKGIAACLYLKPINEKLSDLQIQSCQFINNTAFYLAPNVFSEIPIKALENIFTNNKDAYNFSQELSCFPLLFKLKNHTTKRINIVSGLTIPLNFLITDYFGQEVIFDNQTLAILKPQISNVSKGVALQNDLVQAISGEVNFKNLIIKTDPGTNFSLDISATFAGLGTQGISIESNLDFYARKCIKGEILLADKSCYLCPEGTYSLIDPMDPQNKQQKCYECPDNCYCYGGIYITPKSGYYRKANTSINVVQCLNEEACLGVDYIFDVYDDNYTNDSIIHGACKDGNIDTLCFYCQDGYGKFDKRDYCNVCAEVGVSVYLRLFFYLVFMFVYVLINCHFAETSHQENKSKYANASTFFKIIVNHSQHVIIIISTAGEFPFPSFNSFFNLSDYFAFSNDHVITNDCIIQKVYKDPITLIIFKGVFNTFLPLVFAIGAFSLWVGIKCLFKDSGKIPKNFKTFFFKVLLFVVISIFIFYSLIVKSCFGLFDCMILDKDESSSTNLKESPNLVCWETQHLKYVLLFGIPGVIIWGAAFPGFLFWILRKHSAILTLADKYSIGSQTKKQKSEVERIPNVSFSLKAFEEDEMKKSIKSEKTLANLEQSKVFIFFYKDYYSNFFYWECIIFLRKFILTFLASMIETLSFEINLFLMEIILMLSLYFTLMNFPYKLKSANYVEINSLATCAETVLSAMVFKSIYADKFKSFAAVLCILMNLQFFLFVSLMALKDIAHRHSIIKKNRSQTFGVRSLKAKTIMGKLKIGKLGNQRR